MADLTHPSGEVMLLMLSSHHGGESLFQSPGHRTWDVPLGVGVGHLFLSLIPSFGLRAPLLSLNAVPAAGCPYSPVPISPSFLFSLPPSSFGLMFLCLGPSSGLSGPPSSVLSEPSSTGWIPLGQVFLFSSSHLLFSANPQVTPLGATSQPPGRLAATGGRNEI